MGGCVINSGICLTAAKIFGSAPADTVGDCCYLCDKQSAAKPPCTNFTYNATSKFCTLHNDATDTGNMLSDDCVSGMAKPGAQAATCRDGNKEDCSDQGTCSGGKCAGDVRGPCACGTPSVLPTASNVLHQGPAAAPHCPRTAG